MTPQNYSATSPQSVPEMPPLPQTPGLVSPTRRVIEPTLSRNPGNDQNGGGRAVRSRETDAERLQREAREIRDQEEQQQRAAREQAEPRHREEQQKRDEEAEQARLAEELLAEQKRKDLERLEAELDAAAPGLSTAASSTRERFGFFKRKRSGTKATLQSTRSTSTSDEAQTSSVGRGSEKTWGDEPAAPEPRLKNQEDPPRASEQGGGVVVPGTDAPISAVNAGERVSDHTVHVLQC